MQHSRRTNTVIATFKTSRQALRAVNELVLHGVSDTQLSILVWRGANRLLAPPIGDVVGGAAAGQLAGAVLAALTASSTATIPEVNALGTGPLMDALAGVHLRVAPTASLAERLMLLGFDAAAAESIDASFKNGDIVLGVDTHDHDLSGLAARTFVRQGAQTGAGVAPAATPAASSPRS